MLYVFREKKNYTMSSKEKSASLNQSVEQLEHEQLESNSNYLYFSIFDTFFWSVYYNNVIF